MSKEMEDILKDYREGEYNSKMDIPNKLPDGYITDETKSVIWNRGEIIKRNKDRELAIKEKIENQRFLNKTLNDDIVEYLLSYSAIGNGIGGKKAFNKKQIQKIKDFCFEGIGLRGLREGFDKACDLIDLFDSLCME